MTHLTPMSFVETDLDAMAAATGRIAVIVSPDGTLDQPARRANRLAKGAVARLVESDKFSKAKSGQVITLAWPAGMAAEALDILVRDKKADAVALRKAGVAMSLQA